MIIENLYSRKYKREHGLFPDVYQYDVIPEKLLITLEKIFKREFRTYFDCHPSMEGHQKRESGVKAIYIKIRDIIFEEHSLEEDFLYNFGIIDDVGDIPIALSTEDTIWRYLMQGSNDGFLIKLDIIQLLCCQIFNESLKSNKISPKKTLKEINQRMLDHGFGYQFENGEMIRIDTEHTHSEIVKPALLLLQDDRFKRADKYYRAGFQAFNKGDYENVLIQCNNAFEATMKKICKINNFQDKEKGNTEDMAASALIKILCDSKNKFLKNYDQRKLDGLEKMLSSVSIPRNKEAAHGKSSEGKPIEVSYVNYALHATAANILFLLERQREFKR